MFVRCTRGFFPFLCVPLRSFAAIHSRFENSCSFTVPIRLHPWFPLVVRIIDCHVHLYPEEVFADPAKWGTAHRETWWTECVAPARRRSIQGWASVSELLRDMDRAGVEKCVLLGWYWENQETCDLQNSWYLKWMAAHPDRLLGFATVQPAAGEKAMLALRNALDHGCCGIGELFPAAQGFALNGAEFRSVIKLAIEFGVPMNLHVTDPLLTSAAVTKPTPLHEFIQLAKSFPKAKLILSHWGGGLPFYELNPGVRAALRKVVYDCSASPLLYDRRIFRQVIDLVGPEKVLYGSDYPLLLYPRESQTPEFKRFLNEIMAAGLTAEERGKVFGESLLRLLGTANERRQSRTKS